MKKLVGEKNAPKQQKVLEEEFSIKDMLVKTDDNLGSKKGTFLGEIEEPTPPHSTGKATSKHTLLNSWMKMTNANGPTMVLRSSDENKNFGT
jgi:hypothetical protein